MNAYLKVKYRIMCKILHEICTCHSYKNPHFCGDFLNTFPTNLDKQIFKKNNKLTTQFFIHPKQRIDILPYQILIKVHVYIEINRANVPIHAQTVHEDFSVGLISCADTREKRVKLKPCEENGLHGDKCPDNDPHFFPSGTPAVNSMRPLIPRPRKSATRLAQEEKLL